LSEQGFQAWVGLLRGHAALTRKLNAELIADHGITINDYDVMAQLMRAPERKMRRVDLARSVVLSASGITRLLDGLERDGWVCKASCTSDGRITYAVLTDEGQAKYRAARATHLASVRQLFADRYSCDELEQLAELLGRLDGTPLACETDD
jgi:DNA-binding MarR family transcriptional regulator